MLRFLLQILACVKSLARFGLDLLSFCVRPLHPLFSQVWLPVRLLSAHLWTETLCMMPLPVATRISDQPAQQATNFLDSLTAKRPTRPSTLPNDFRDWVARSLTGQQTEDPDSSRVYSRLGNRDATGTQAATRTVLSHASRRSGLSPLELLTMYPNVISAALMMELESMIFKEKIAKSTAATYASQAQRMLRRVPGVPPEDLQVLKDYIHALNRDGAKIPQRQAPPLTKTQLQSLLISPRAQSNLRLRAVLWVAWKTCSRIDEVIKLPLPLERPTHQELLIKWEGATKTSTVHPHAPRFHTILSWNHSDSTTPDAEVLRLLTEGSGTVGLGLSTRDVHKALESTFPGMHHTAHSVKRGAIDFLWSLKQDQVPVEVIEMVAKHQSAKAAPLGEIHLRYLTHNVSNAVRRLGSHLATMRL